MTSYGIFYKLFTYISVTAKYEKWKILQDLKTQAEFQSIC